MSIETFAADLGEKLSRDPIGRSIRTEERLERDFVIPIASRIASRAPDVLLFTHPFRGERRCAPSARASRRRVLGESLGVRDAGQRANHGRASRVLGRIIPST